MRYNASNGLPRQDIQAAIQLAQMDFVPLTPEIFIPTPVDSMKGNVGIIPVEALTSVPGDLRRKRKSGSARSDWELADQAYACQTYSIEESVTEEDAALVQSMFDAQMFAAARNRAIILRAQEARAVALLHSTATWTGATLTAAASVAWTTSASADPIGDINNARSKIRLKCGMTTISMQISFASWQALSLCDQVRQALKYTNQPEGLIPLSGLASVLGVKRLLCPADGNVVNGSKEGQTAALAEIWTANKAFVFVDMPAKDPKQPVLGRMWSYEKAGGLMTIDEYPEPQTESVVTRAKQCVQEKIISTGFGFLITGT